MGGSVAGQIRIDLLANAAQFKAGMREAGREGIGGFQQEAEKFNRSFNSKKAIEERAKAESVSWAKAMRSADGPLNNVDGFLGGLSVRDKNRQRWGELLRGEKASSPWGMTMRTELTREAALTAATAAKSGKLVADSLRVSMKGIGNVAIEAGNAAGFGGLIGTVGKFAMGHPLLTGAGLAATFMAKQVHDRDVLTRDVRRNSLMLGQGAEDTSRMMAVGVDADMMTKFQKSMADQTPEQTGAFNKLGLDPDKLAAKPLIQALSDVAGGFDRLKNPADRASAAMHIFGRGGSDVIATMAAMKEKMDMVGAHEVIKPSDIERTKAWDKALKGASNTLGELSLWASRKLGGESGIGTMLGRGVEWWGYTLSGDTEGYNKFLDRIGKEDYNVQHADEIDKARAAQAKLADEGERYAAAMSKAQDKIQSLRDRVEDLSVGDEEAARNRFMRDAEKDGVKNAPMPPGLSEYDKRFVGGQDLTNLMNEYDAAAAERKNREQDKRDRERADSIVEKLPREKYDAETKEAEELFKKKKIDADTLARLERKYLESYYDEVAQLEERRLKTSFASELDLHNARKKDISDRRDAGLLEPAAADRGIDRENRDYRSRLGIKDHLGDYVREMNDLRDARDAGVVSGDEFDVRSKELRTSAVAGIAGDRHGVQLNGAMAAGSAEAHSVIAQSMVADPKVKLATDANKLLEKLDRGLLSLGEAMRALVELQKR